MLSRIFYKTLRKLGLIKKYKSETSKIRQLVLPYCVGYGCDIGFGGDKIKPDAVGIDFANPYANTGADKVDIPCDVIKNEIPVADNSFDYVYTSHLIEDFDDTKAGLRKFLRILKDGGNLILVFPDQQKYERICKKTGQPLNQYHKHADMGMEFMLKRLQEIKEVQYKVIFSSDRQIDYNVVLVLQINKNG